MPGEQYSKTAFGHSSLYYNTFGNHNMARSFSLYKPPR